MGRKLSFFSNPSAYIGQPYRHVGNQLGHVALGAATVWLLSTYLSMPVLAFVWVIAAMMWLAWETGQVLLFNAKAFDALEDCFFFLSGIFAYAFDMPFHFLGLAAIICASGFYRRLTEAGG